jgi:DNA-directed RNA polymerase specialized sigma24 family protein
MPARADLAQLIDSVRSGRREGWDELVAHFSPLLWAVARGHGLDSSSALEVAQTSWLRLIEHLPGLDATSATPWLAVATRDEARRVLRWSGDDPRVVTTHPLWREVDRLPMRCRLSLRVMATDPPPSSDELAAVLDLPVEAAEQSLAACVERLGRGDEVLAELREACTLVDPPPATVVATGRAAYSWRTVDAELAAVAHDSLLDDDVLVLRGRDEVRTLSFRGGGLRVEIEVSGIGDSRSIVGQLSPASSAAVVVRGAEADVAHVEADDLGRFLYDGLAAGPVSLRVTMPALPPVHTDWVII